MKRPAGRPPKPYVSSANEAVVGLTKCKDGRWRVAATATTPEVRFSESDEEKAIERFFKVTGRRRPRPEPSFVPVRVQAAAESLGDAIERGGRIAAANMMAAVAAGTHKGGLYRPNGSEPYAVPTLGCDADGKATLRYDLDPEVVWPWVREQVSKMTPVELAEKLGPRFLGIRFETKADSIALKRLADNYQSHGTATDKTKVRALKVWGEFVAGTGAKTLDALTTDRLMAFRSGVEADPKRQSGAYKTWFYGCIKSVIGFGLKTGFDADQIAAALARCKVLWSGSAATVPSPTPIAPADVHSLLKAASPVWRATILVGLNCALHLEEVCALEWVHFDMDAGTYATIRNKTKADRIPRAAVLWPETIAALNGLPRKGPKYVFTSPHGTRYNRASRGNKFAILRTKAEVSENVTFDWFKDGAYTAAINATGVEERFARVLAGHRSPGLQDSYVLRNPRCTAGACEAVYRAYGPFEAPAPDPSGDVGEP